MRRLKILLGLALTVGLASLAHGDLVYENGAGGSSGIQNGYGSDASLNNEVADDAILANAANIARIDWTGVYANEQTLDFADDFRIRVYADDGTGLPGSLLHDFHVGDAVNRSDSGISLFSIFRVYEYSANINFAMDAGSKYHFSIVNDTTADADDIWLWGHRTFGGDTTFRAGSSAWNSTTRISDFQLHSAIPEPGSIAVLSMLVLGLTFRRNHQCELKV